MALRKPTKALPIMAEAEIAIVRIAPETSFKNKAYEALKEAILKMDIYTTPEPVMLDERALSERLGVSRTPIREAIAMLEQDGFVKTVPRRGIVVVRRTKSEIVDMIRAWAALESMAARPRAKRTFPRCATFSRILARIAGRRIMSRNIRRPTSPFTRR